MSAGDQSDVSRAGSLARPWGLVRSGERVYAQNRSSRRISLNQQPRPAAMHVLPILDTQLEAINAQVDLGEFGRHHVRSCLAKLKLMQFARTAERTVELVHSRTGKGPPPDSSSMR